MFDSFPLVLSFLSRTSTNVWGVVNRANRFLGFNQYSGELVCLAQGHNTSGDRTKDLSIRSSMFNINCVLLSSILSFYMYSWKEQNKQQ